MKPLAVLLLLFNLSQDAVAAEERRHPCEELLTLALTTLRHETYIDIKGLIDLDREVIHIVRLLDLEQAGYDFGHRETLARFNAMFPALEALIKYDRVRRNEAALGMLYVNAIERIMAEASLPNSRLAWLRHHIQRRLDY